MDLDNGLQALLSWNFFLFAIGIAILVFIFRTVIEHIFPMIMNRKVYSEVFLPIFPPSLGALVAFLATNYAYPNNMSSLSDRLIFGAVAGAFSGLAYRVVKSTISQKISQEITTVTTTTNTQYPAPTTNTTVVTVPPTNDPVPLPSPPQPPIVSTTTVVEGGTNKPPTSSS
jgi:hypothetical protein